MAEASTTAEVQSQQDAQTPMTEVDPAGGQGGTPDLAEGTAQCARCIWYPWLPGADVDYLPVERCHPALPQRRWSDGGDVAIHNCPYFEPRPDLFKLYLTPVTEKPDLEAKPIPYGNGSPISLEEAAAEVVIGGKGPEQPREEIIIHSPVPGATFSAGGANMEDIAEARDAHRQRVGGTWGEKLEAHQAVRPTGGMASSLTGTAGLSSATQELLDTGAEEEASGEGSAEEKRAKRQQALQEAAEARAEEGTPKGLSQNSGTTTQEGTAATPAAPTTGTTPATAPAAQQGQGPTTPQAPPTQPKPSA
jgi:hypothetical protein